MIPPDQTPRDAIANMVMEFRGIVEGDAHPSWTISRTISRDDFTRWASRLERAVQKLDAENVVRRESNILAEAARNHARLADAITVADFRAIADVEAAQPFAAPEVVAESQRAIIRKAFVRVEGYGAVPLTEHQEDQ